MAQPDRYIGYTGPTYDKDGRKPLPVLYDRDEGFFKLVHSYHWHAYLLHTQHILLPDGTVGNFPIYGFASRDLTDATDVFISASGVHGEEPASIEAARRSIDRYAAYAEDGINIFLAPVLNPAGYFRNWRYQNMYRRSIWSGTIFHQEQSVTDPDHILPSKYLPALPRLFQPSSDTARALVQCFMNIDAIALVDHHEDRIDETGLQKLWHDLRYFYGYANGDPEVLAMFLPMFRALLEMSGFRMQESGMTRFGEEIVNGFVLNPDDGSLEQAIAATRHLLRRSGSGWPWLAMSHHPVMLAVVPETIIYPEQPQTIDERAAIHESIIGSYGLIYQELQAYRARQRTAYSLPAAKTVYQQALEAQEK